jgi:hypothetical protein
MLASHVHPGLFEVHAAWSVPVMFRLVALEPRA